MATTATSSSEAVTVPSQDECTVTSVAGSKGMEAAAAQLDECTGSSVAGSKGMEAAAAQLRGKLLHLRPGDYTLASDQDPSVGETELHLLLHFCCESQLVCWCDGSVVCDRVFSLSVCGCVCRVVRGLWWYACVCGKR